MKKGSNSLRDAGSSIQNSASLLIPIEGPELLMSKATENTRALYLVMRWRPILVLIPADPE
jgi:hypothetical protein